MKPDHAPIDNAPRRVPAVPAVDAVFVPNGPTAVDPAGHVFPFPATDGQTFQPLCTGGPLPVAGRIEVAARFAGVDYAAPPHAVLFVHSNRGATLYLDAVRRLYPGRRLTRFRCVIGTGDPAPTTNPPRRADVFVLVDGRPRFERRGLTTLDPPIAVDVTFGDADRFLTLATTDGGDGNGRDWVLVADPVLDAADGRPGRDLT